MKIEVSNYIQKNRTKERIEKFSKITYLTIGIVTLLSTLSFIIFHFYTSSVLGYNPKYNSPDYNDIPINYMIVELGILIIYLLSVAMCFSLYIFPIIFLINIFLKFKLKIRLYWEIILFSFICCLSILLIFYVPEFEDTFSWLMD